MWEGRGSQAEGFASIFGGGDRGCAHWDPKDAQGTGRMQGKFECDPEAGELC